jgi:hypothetical protein
MTLPKLLLVPDADGYSSTDGNEVIGTPLDGGAGRYRRDKIGATKIVNLRWTMSRSQYQYWRAFFVVTTSKGALSFTCDLLSEDGTGPAEHVCNFVPGSVSLLSQSGFTYVQQAQLEVTPLARNAIVDAAVLALYSEGDEVDDNLRVLARLVNVTAPESLGG